MPFPTNDRDLILASLPPPPPQELPGNAVIRVGDGKTISLSEVASNSLVPTTSFLGAFSYAPGPDIGAGWKQNATYRNTRDNTVYILTGSPLQWEVYLEAGSSYTLTIESTNGTVFKAGEQGYTLLKARLFKNGAEVTESTPSAWFLWRRVSQVPSPHPYDDATWTASHQGFKVVEVDTGQVKNRATFSCDIVSPD